MVRSLLTHLLGRVPRKASAVAPVVSSLRVVEQPEASGRASLTFVQHRTNVFNLGDFLSSPRHYFTFTPIASGKPTLVVGGGVFGNYEQLRQRMAPAAIDGMVKVAWGIGLSKKLDGAHSGQLVEMGRHFDFARTRDPAFASHEVPFCPCASVFNGIADIVPGKRTGVLLNFDPRASGEAPLALINGFSSNVVGSNAVSEADFRMLFAETSHIVTNSYHTAYWGLLTGRSVGIVGFSTKYRNIAAMFGLDTSYVDYPKGDGIALKQAIADVLKHGRFVKIENPEGVKQHFRDLNMAYARSLVEAGIFARVEPIADSQAQLHLRNREIFADYILADAS